MKNSNQFQSWLSCIWHLYPPTALAHIGAGYGPSVIPYADWGIEHVLLVDADSNACTQLVKNYATRHNWKIKEALIAPGIDAAVFHVASSPAESSLLDPERIRQFWPNLRISEDAERPQATLEAIISESFSGKAFPNWLVFGGFQAEALLASAPILLKSVEVICARVITKAGYALDSCAHLDSLNTLMAGNGFHLVGVEEERNPAIGHALFVRDYKSLTRLTSLQLSQAKAEAEKQLAERSDQLSQANQAKDTQAKLAAERQIQIEQLNQAKAEAEKQLAERSDQLSQANQAKDTQAKLAAERQIQIEQLNQAKAEAEKQLAERSDQLSQANQAKDTQAKLAAERQIQIEQLNQAKAEAEKQLAERSDQLTQANQAKDTQAKLAAERQTQIERLTQAKDEAEKQRSDLLLRQQLMHGEINRAEAQIDFVKELFLREKSL